MRFDLYFVVAQPKEKNAVNVVPDRLRHSGPDFNRRSSEVASIRFITMYLCVYVFSI